MINKFAKSSIISGALLYLVSNIINAVIPFALLPILTRNMTPSEYGEVAMFQTYLSALGAFVGLNVVGAAGRKFYEKKLSDNDFNEYIGNCLIIIGATGVCVLLLTLVFSEFISEIVGLSRDWVVLSVFVSSALTVVNLRLGQWQVKREAFIYGVFQVSLGILNMMLSLYMVLWEKKGSDGRIGAQSIVIVFFSFIALYSLCKNKNLFNLNKSYIIDALKFGIPLLPHVAGGFLLASVDRFIINKKLGMHEAGIYMVAVQLSFILSIVFDAINKSFVPWLFEKLNKNKYDEKLKIVKYTYLWFVIIIAINATIFAIGGDVVVFVAGEEYRRAGEIFGWIALGQGFGGMYLMVTNYIFYAKKTGMLSLATTISGVINVLLLMYGVDYLGIMGAAVSYSLAMLLRFFLTWWVSYKSYYMPWAYFMNK